MKRTFHQIQLSRTTLREDCDDWQQQQTEGLRAVQATDEAYLVIQARYLALAKPNFEAGTGYSRYYEHCHSCQRD